MQAKAKLKLLQAIQPVLQNGAKMNISLLGRINLVIMMIISPKIHYILYILNLTFPPNLLK